MSYFCKNCGVELERDMPICPLCGKTVADSTSEGGLSRPNEMPQPPAQGRKAMNHPQKKIIWEIISVTIFSLLLVTISIDYILNRNITWSEYPVAISLIIFSYVSMFAFLNKNSIVKITGGFVLSSAFMLVVDALTGGIHWAVELGIPLLFSGNIFTVLLLGIIHISKRKGLNLVAYTLILSALYSLGIEGILSSFKTGSIHLQWSIIVVACVFPVAFVLLFMHYRLVKNRILERVFHL